MHLTVADQLQASGAQAVPALLLSVSGGAARRHPSELHTSGSDEHIDDIMMWSLNSTHYMCAWGVSWQRAGSCVGFGVFSKVLEKA